MRGLSNRVATLERGRSPALSPAVKAWLGWPLTDAEQQVLNDGGDLGDTAEIDTSTWSKELKAWLGVE